MLLFSQTDVSDYTDIFNHLQQDKGGITLNEILAIDDQKRELENRRNFHLPRVSEEDMPVVVSGLEGGEEGNRNVLLNEMTRSPEHEETAGIVLMNPPAERVEVAIPCVEDEVNPSVSLVVHSANEMTRETPKPEERITEDVKPIVQEETRTQETVKKSKPKKNKEHREKKKERNVSAKESIVLIDLAIPNNNESL